MTSQSTPAFATPVSVGGPATHHFATRAVPRQGLATCRASAEQPATRSIDATLRRLASTALLSTALLTGATFTGPTSVESANNTVRLPPIDRTDAKRCEPASSAIGQANAARDKLLDLRECDLRGRDLSEFDISGALMSDANLGGAKLVGAQLSKSYAPSASFKGVDFTNAIVDRVTFDKADLSGAIFANAVLSDSTFDDANMEGVDFTDVYVGDFVQRSICKNPTTKGTNPTTGAPTRESLGCR